MCIHIHILVYIQPGADPDAPLLGDLDIKSDCFSTSKNCVRKTVFGKIQERCVREHKKT